MKYETRELNPILAIYAVQNMIQFKQRRFSHDCIFPGHPFNEICPGYADWE